MAKLTRRGFLVGSGAAAGAAVLAGCTDNGQAGSPAATTGSGTGDPAAAFDPADWASVRAQFSLAPDSAHFNAWVFASPPRVVGEAISRHRAGLDADTLAYQEENEGTLDVDTLAAAGEYLDADPAQLALTDSTTMGLGMVYGGLRLRPDQQVLTTEHDFYSTHEALRLTAERTGATVNRVSLYDDPASASAEDIVARLIAGITPQTRVVAVTWVHSGTGVKLPVPDIAAAVATANAGRAEADRALLFVDGVHGFGVEDVTVADLGCDVLVSGTHKWLFGSRGTGLVWANESAWALIAPVIPSFDIVNFQAWLDGVPPVVDRPGQAGTPGGFHTFEYRWALAEALRFHLAIGKDRVQEWTHTQATQLKEGLAGLAGVRVVTPMAAELSSGMVCLAFDSLDPFESVLTLREAGFVAGLTPYRTGYVRVGPSLVTDCAGPPPRSRSTGWSQRSTTCCDALCDERLEGPSARRGRPR